ncbi:MAG: hypothetical protein B7Y43_18740 [Sphingomonas sp. 28-62-20]|uniref:hypothetical protein n=1 Tax=Sphingomonas sp. 28-62-20 TaxID=1970433 RepID=UPI000BC69620|nr:MAG: hypothetical protein B7Y43_18740 [Sphingomonas sp. 28-62-20]
MIAAALRYFAIVFAAAFAFGTARTLWITPAIGATAAVLIEVPLILIVSAITARAIVRRRPVLTRSAALGIGAIAFLLLMAAEATLAVGAFGMSPGGWLATLNAMPGRIGLAGQLVYALMPFIVREAAGRQSSLPRRR